MADEYHGLARELHAFASLPGPTRSWVDAERGRVAGGLDAQAGTLHSIAGRLRARAREARLADAADGHDARPTRSRGGRCASGVPPHKVPFPLPMANDRYVAALQGAKARLPSEPDPSPRAVVRPAPDRIGLPDYARAFVPAEQPAAVQQARAGELSKGDLARIAHDLEHQQNFERVREQLLVMLHAGDASHRSAVERYLDFRSDPEVARLALVTLCAGWGLTRFLVDRLSQFIEGVVWDWADSGPAVRPAAFTLAGAYLARRRSRSLLELLLRIAEDSGEDRAARSQAARGLNLAYGSPLERVEDHVEPGDEVFEWVLGEARERLQTE